MQNSLSSIVPVNRGAEIPIAPGASSVKSLLSSPVESDVPFADVFQQVIKDVDGAQVQAQQTVDRLLAGEDVPIHEVSLQMAQAELSLKLLMEIRNRAITAYQEIMRTQM
ncbi:MAG: flagellar hook-basal body complex protein FliE [Planctomycetaceae bacterium]